MSFSKILVPVDGSEPSTRALQFAVRLAEETGATIELVTVLDLGQLDFYDGMYRTIEQVEHWQERLRERVIAEALATIPEGGPPVETVLLKGAAVKAILARIEEVSPDVVVMGRTGRGAIDRMLHGSVSRRIAALSPVPVTVVA